MDASTRKFLIPYAGSCRRYREPDSDTLTPKQEAFLSYLMGLAAEPLEIGKDTLLADMEIGNRVSYYKFINALLSKGFIRRLARGSQHSIGLFVVVRRLEEARPLTERRLQAVYQSMSRFPSRRRLEGASA